MWLSHHGIKGQQWGVRNGPPYPIEDKVLRKGTQVNSVSAYRSSKKYKKATQVKYLEQKKKETKYERTADMLYTTIAALINPITLVNSVPYNIQKKEYVKEYFKKLDEYISNNQELTQEAQNKMYVFNPNDEHDRKIYTGPFSKYLTKVRGIQTVYEHKFETVKDLKMPNSTERFEAFKELMKKDSIKYYKDLQDFYENYKYSQFGMSEINKRRIEKGNKLDFSNLKTKEDFRDAYLVFNSLMEDPAGSKITKDYINIMSKRFDAMVDDNNAKVYNDAHDPIIIFNAAVNLVQRQNPKKIKMKDIETNFKEIDEYMRKNYNRYALL